ncbi:MAG: SRPBCC family protein [Planctomycetota bacterium]
MTVLRIVAFGAAALLLLAFLAGSFLPSAWQVDRTTSIAASPAAVFVEIADAHALARWFPPPSVTDRGPVAAQDSDLVTWTAPRGATCALRILARAPHERVELELVRSGVSERATISIAPEGTGTRVHWQQAGDVGRNPVMRACRTLLAARAASNVEAVLARLRTALEQSAAR